MQQAFPIRVEMGHHDKGHPAPRRDPFEQVRQRIDTPGRGSDTDNEWQISNHAGHATVLLCRNPQGTAPMLMRGYRRILLSSSPDRQVA